MPDVEGIVVELETGSQTWAGTDDHLFLGVVGTDGGREFNLNVSGFDDYEPGTKVNYELGEEFAFDAAGPEKTPIKAPAALTGGSSIEQTSVTHVYLRKHGLGSPSADDAWRLQSARVWLFAGGTPTLVFSTRGPLTLSIENGLQIWLSADFE